MKQYFFSTTYVASLLTCFAKPSTEWREAQDFSEGLSRVWTYSIEHKQSLYGFIDRKGTFQIPLNADWEDVRSFSEGVALFKKGGLWGLINKDGDVVAKPQWADVRGNYKFSSGLAIVGVGEIRPLELSGGSSIQREIFRLNLCGHSQVTMVWDGLHRISMADWHELKWMGNTDSSTKRVRL